MDRATWSSWLACVAVVVCTALLLGLHGARPAHACSCAEPDLAPVVAGAADQALVLAQRVDLDGGPQGAVEVLETLAGGPVVGPVDARFDDGGSCDPGVAGGAVAALLLAREARGWTTTMCGQLPVGRAVAAVGLPATPDPGARDPTLLLGGDFGGVRVAAVDAAGRVAAWAGDAGRTLALGVCPGHDTVVEVASADGNVTLHRWALPDLEPRGDAVPLGAERSWDAAVRCLDGTGSRAVVVLPAYGEDGTIAVVDGSDAERRATPVQAAAVDGTTMAVLLASGGLGEGAASTIGVVDDGGGITELANQPTVTFDRLEVSPEGGHVLAAGYPVEGGGDVLLSVAADGSERSERQTDTYHRIGWFADDRIWLRVEDGPFGATTTTVDLLDIDLHAAGSVDVGATAEVQRLPDGALLRHGLAPPSVLRKDGVSQVGALRLTDTHVAIPLAADAILTAMPAQTSVPSPTASAAATPAVDAGPASPVRLPWLLGALAVALPLGAWGVRRRGRPGRWHPTPRR